MDTSFVSGVTLSNTDWAQDVNNALYRGIGLGVITTIASSATPNIFAVTTGGVIDYTGTETCTGFTAATQAGARRTLVCAAAAVFTADANMIIDGVASGSNLTVVALDKVEVLAVTTTQFHLTLKTYAATQAQQETGTILTAVVTPGRQQFHPSAAKGWVMADTAATAVASFNVTSVTDVGTGRLAVVWNVDFSSNSYSVVATAKFDPTGTTDSTLVAQVENTNFIGGTTQISILRVSDGAGTDPNHTFVAAYGDQ